jgi:SAM-dependent methyltransferase
MDIIGRAIHEFHSTGKDLPIRQWINNREEPVLYPSVFFRGESEMNELELAALHSCKGSVLDVGAGAGCHSLILQDRGLDVTSLEISDLSCSVMKSKGLKDVVCADVMAYQDKKFDCVLLMMNGFGIAGSEDKLPDFLRHLKSLLLPGGCIIGESTDIFYLHEKEVGGVEFDLSKGYYGEVQFKLMSRVGEANFPWIYVDEFLLEAIALEVGLTFEILERGDRYNFLCKLAVQS